MSIGRAGAAVTLCGSEIFGFLSCTVDWEIFAVKIFPLMTLTDEIKHAKYYVYRAIPNVRLATKLDDAKILQLEYFTGENIPIYGIAHTCM